MISCPKIEEREEEKTARVACASLGRRVIQRVHLLLSWTFFDRKKNHQPIGSNLNCTFKDDRRLKRRFG